MQDSACAGVDSDGQAAGNGVIDCEVLALEHAVGGSSALGHLDEDRFDAVLAALLGDQRERELRTDDRDVGAQLEQERNRADVVFVRVGHHERFDIVETVLDMAQIGQDQVDAGLVVLGEEHAAVHDQQPAEVLENGHVAADFVDATQRGHAQAARGQRPRRSEF